MPYVTAWSRAFALTVLTELLVAWPLLGDDEPGKGRRLGLVVYAQIMSHPAVWFIIPALSLPWGSTVLLAEGWAVLSETLFYALVFKGLPLRRAFGVSALANGASYGLGLFLQWRGWLPW